MGIVTRPRFADGAPRAFHRRCSSAIIRLRLSPARSGRWPDQLRRRFELVLSPRGLFCGQDSARHAARRTAGGIPDQDDVVDQSQDGKGARYYGAADAVGSRRRGDRVGVECLLLALSGHSSGSQQCPLSGVKRTLIGRTKMSAYDPKAASARSKFLRCSPALTSLTGRPASIAPVEPPITITSFAFVSPRSDSYGALLV